MIPKPDVDRKEKARPPKPMTAAMKRRLMPTETRADNVGPRVTALRRNIGLKKLHFARSIGLDPSSLTKIEAGTMNLDIRVAARIWKLYGYSMDWIYLGIADALGHMRTSTLEHYENVLRERASDREEE